MQVTSPSSTHPGLGRSFWLIWASTAISLSGDGVMFVALPLLARDLTGNGVLIAGVFAAQRLPWFLVGVRAGLIVDRSHPVVAVVRADLLRFGALGVLAVAVVAEVAAVWQVYLAALILGVGDVIFSAGAASLVPAVVPESSLPKANGRIAVGEAVGEAGVGPPLGGWLYSLGRSIPLVIDAGSFLVSALLLRRVRVPIRMGEDSPPEPPGAGSAIRWYFAIRPLRTLTLLTMPLAACQAMVVAVLVILVRDEYDLSSTSFGLFAAFTASGNVLGGLLSDRTWARLGSRWTLTAAVALSAAAFIIAGLTTVFAVVCIALFVESLCVPIGNVVTMTMRQTLVAPNRRGQVGNIFRLFVLGCTPLGALLGGVVAEVADARAALAVAGAVLLVLAVAPLRGVWTDHAFSLPPGSARIHG